MPPKKITNSPNILSRVALDLIFMLEATRREPNRIHRCLQQTLFTQVCILQNVRVFWLALVQDATTNIQRNIGFVRAGFTE